MPVSLMQGFAAHGAHRADKETAIRSLLSHDYADAHT
jgi:hypothetical protein